MKAPSGGQTKERWFRCQGLLRRGGWLEPAYVAVDAQGRILQVVDAAPAADIHVEEIPGYAIPGFQNAHSHAFQYAMAGLAEHLPAQAARDDFWSWRQAMYGLAQRVSPDEVEAIASMLYSEMLRCGYTAVTEFHYLHHDVSGAPYKNPAEMGARLMAAAARAGIHLTLVPVLYRQGGFGRPAMPAQRRFLADGLDSYARLLEATHAAAARQSGTLVGVGVHSLRAVPPDEVRALLGQPFTGPAHLHVAEQSQEVKDCVAHLGQRPVAWLLANLPLDQRFNLVHATHLDADEVQQLAATDATVVLCPSTEGNLGDGFFPLQDYLAAGGAYAIGTDSHIGLSPLEELRWLDYGQRLRHERRNILCTQSGQDSGALSFDLAWTRGRMAMGQTTVDYFAPGEPFDAVILDPGHPVLYGKPADRRLAALVYAGESSCYLGTLRGGLWVVRGGRHERAEEIGRAYRQAMSALAADKG